jgi:hypothetical protein
MSGPAGSTADRTAQNDSEGFVSRYHKFASLSLKRQRELLPIFTHRQSPAPREFLVLTICRNIVAISRRTLSRYNRVWADRLREINSSVPFF